jgi:hypothetical protein
MLSDEQCRKIQEIIRNAASKVAADKAAADEAAKSPRTSSSLFNASSGVPSSSGGVVEAKAKSDAATTAALKGASPAEILEIWKQVHAGGNIDEANREFLEAFKGKK